MASRHHYLLSLSTMFKCLFLFSKPNFMWSILRERGKKVDVNSPGHMTKMAAMPIYVKNL